MTSWKSIVLFFLVCRTVSGQVNPDNDEGICVLTGEAKEDKPFPDLEKEGIFSFQMAVEYTVPNSNQTDFYKEYYDIQERQGRVDSYINGSRSTYIYFPSSLEAFELGDSKCQLKNVTDIPEFSREDLSEWLYVLGDEFDKKQKKGPSAMFQAALDSWTNPERNRVFDMAYMGASNTTVRGLEAQYWRRCISRTYYADYYFTTDDHDDAFGFDKLKQIPLRVVFRGTDPERKLMMMPQNYDILSFQPFISEDNVFDLPYGEGCTRGDQLKGIPDLPDFTNKNLMFNSEVVYETNSIDQIWRYYSNLAFALDLETNHMAYFYTPWVKSSKKENVDDEPEAGTPQFAVYDTKNKYVYTRNFETGQCKITRLAKGEKYIPKYTLPKDGGYIALTDPGIVFTNNELDYITETSDRGLRVHVFEGTVENFDLKTRRVPKVIISHAYLKENEVDRNVVSVKEALTRVHLRMITPEKNLEELLNFNFYGLTTQIMFKSYVFDISKCFKNDDDYLWVTLGFPADENVIDQIKQDVPNIETDIQTAMQLKTELNALRIPKIMVDFSDAVYVSVLILQKPNVMMDFLPEPQKDKTITGSTDVEGILPLEACANKCLEGKDGCWGFSICGSTCTFGTTQTTSATITDKDGCLVYERYDNTTFLQSMDMIVDNLRGSFKELRLMLKKSNGEFITLEPSSIEVTQPSSEDELFDRLGNERNPRFKVLKVGSKLKSTDPKTVKNVGRYSYAQCQKMCLDFKECESLSFCLDNSECLISKLYGNNLKEENFEEKNTCTVLSRTYIDNFERSPGNMLSTTAMKILDIKSAENCAKECVQTANCASFDHCAAAKNEGCRLHSVYFPNSKTREIMNITQTGTCGHYFKKYSNQYKVKYERKMVMKGLPSLTNVTLEECSKACFDYGSRSETCYGFDFCQTSALYATSCTILDRVVSNLETIYNPICNNYLIERKPLPKLPAPIERPYSTSYAGGIGFLCFIVGGVLGVGIVFTIAYLRVNRSQ